ncbi:MAG: efflux RND transporter periplasmic adaptor subunit [Gemmatimonadaceae bacterium]
MTDLHIPSSAPQRPSESQAYTGSSLHDLDAEIGAPESTARRNWIIGAGILMLIVIIAAFSLRRTDHTQFLSSPVQQGEIRDAVDATGTVNAVVTVLVGSQVSGTISRLNADFNSRVHKGDVIAVIDPSLLQATLLQATADLENAKANVTGAQAGLKKANAALVQSKADFDRAAALAKTNAGTQQELDLARANYESAKASVDAAEAGVVQAKAQVNQKDAAVAMARTNLDHTVIRSPIDGIVVARNVDVGQTVAASLQAPTIFTIAQDLTKMQVYAKVDESDVGRIKLGHPVTFKVDAFPKDRFSGTVSQLRMNPTTVQNVVTYDAIIDFQNPDLKLFPGMTAYVTIPVATAENVVKLPNAALRFNPPLSPEQVRALYAKYGIDQERLATSADGGDASPAAPARRSPRTESVVVWKMRPDGTIEPVQLTLGITDHAYTEVTQVLRGSLKPGDDVVTTAVTSKSASGPQAIRR